MIDLSKSENQILYVDHFDGLVSIPFQGHVNAICWTRQLIGNFQEIVSKVVLTENVMAISMEELQEFQLSEEGNQARRIILNDMQLLSAHGADPLLNLIKCYDRDDSVPFFPTDVYSYHVDRSPIPTDTFLVTYFGAASDILPNAQAIQKVLVPSIREELKSIYAGPDAGFEDFLIENFFDLHYQPLANAQPINLGVGHLWRLAIDHPQTLVSPCIHRAPLEKEGEYRLMLIC